MLVVSPDGVAPSRMVRVSASVNLPLHRKVQKFSPGTGSPGWSRKEGRKTVVVVVDPSLWSSTLCHSGSARRESENLSGDGYINWRSGFMQVGCPPFTQTLQC